MREKLSRIRSRWRRLLITVLISLLLVTKHFSSPRARIHWIGSHRRPRRRERPLTALLFVCGVLLLKPREYAYWAALAGGMISIFLVLHTIYLFFPRKRAHWIP